MEVVAYHQVGIVWGISVHVQEVVVYCQSPNDVVMTVRNWKAAGRSRSTMVRHTQGATSDTFRTSRDGPSEAATLRSCRTFREIHWQPPFISPRSLAVWLLFMDDLTLHFLYNWSIRCGKYGLVGVTSSNHWNVLKMPNTQTIN